MGIFWKIFALNCLLFSAWRFYLLRTDGLAGKFIFERGQNASEDEMTFLCAGCFNQPRAAFDFMKNELQDRNCTYIHYSCWGWSAKSTAKKIVESAAYVQDPKVEFYAISLGTHIAHYVELGAKSEVKVHAINPCPAVETLRRPLRIALLALSPFFLSLCHLLGFLSAIPLFSTPGGRYSLVLLADQYFELAYGGTAGSNSTQWLILSEKDALLDNSAVTKFYRISDIVRMMNVATTRSENEFTQTVRHEMAPGVVACHGFSTTDDISMPIAIVPTSHADTVGSGKFYRAAVDGLTEMLSQPPN